MQKPFADLLSDVLWYVHALDSSGIQKSIPLQAIYKKISYLLGLFEFRAIDQRLVRVCLLHYKVRLKTETTDEIT